MKKFLKYKVIFLIMLVIPVAARLSAYDNVRIMSYNIENFWLRFDGEPGSITDQGAAFDEEDLARLEIVAGVINREKPDVIGILECASLAELLFFNEIFLEEEYRCWSFRARDSRTFGIPLGLMLKKHLQVKSVKLVEPESFSLRGIIVTDIAKGDYELTLILVHLKSKIEEELGESAVKRDRQGNRLREIIKEKLEANPNANIIVCGDFNDSPGRDDQEKAANVEDLIAKMLKPIMLADGTQVAIHSPTLEEKDVDISGELWTEKTEKYGTIQFDYFFLTQGANDEFLRIDHVYAEEFHNILKASDHIPIVLDLGDE